MNKERSETETRNLELVQVGFERWKEGTGSVYDLLAPTTHWTIVGNSVMSKVYQSRQEFMDEVIHPFNSRLSVLSCQRFEASRLNTYMGDARGKIAILLEIRRRLDVSRLLPQMLPLGLCKKAAPF